MASVEAGGRAHAWSRHHADRAPAIVFIGFMGAGKTTAANAARAAGLSVTETDELLEIELGMPIIKFFGRRGEEEFRALEAAEVGKLLENADGGVVALGGGAVYSERIRRALERHVVVWLQVSAEEAWRRVQGSERPLAQDRARFEELHAEREPIYAHLADAILPAADEELVKRVLPSLLALGELPHGTRMAWGMSASGEYPAFVGPGLLEADWWPLESRRFGVSDTVVAKLYGDAVQPLAGMVTVDPGERAKTLAEADALPALDPDGRVQWVRIFAARHAAHEDIIEVTLANEPWGPGVEALRAALVWPEVPSFLSVRQVLVLVRRDELKLRLKL